MSTSRELTQKRAYLMLFITAFLWSCVSVIYKKYMADLTPLHFMFSRFWIAFIIFFLFVRKQVQLNKHKLFHGGIVGIFLCLAYYTSIVALDYTTASKAGFFFALSVLWVPIAQTFIKRKLPNIWVATSVVLSIIGLVLISGLDGIGLNMGDVIAIASSLTYTGYILYINRYVTDMNENELTLVVLGVVALISTFAVGSVEGIQTDMLINNAWPILFTAIFSTLLTTYLQTKAQQVASPEAVGIILLGEPVFTFLMAVTVLQESVVMSGVMGAIILMASLVIAVVKDV